MKKVLKLLTCIMLIFTLCGCQKSEYEGKYKLDSIIVGDKVYKQDDTGWETILGANIDGENIVESCLKYGPSLFTQKLKSEVC